MKNRARRDRPELRALVVLACAAAVVAGTPSARAAGAPGDGGHWLTPSDRHTVPGDLSVPGVPPEGRTTAPLDRARLVREGAALYAIHCSSCHAADLGGSTGVPSLLETGAAATDFYVTTGRMPIAVRSNADDPTHAATGIIMAQGTQEYHQPAHFDARQTAALDAFVASRARHDIPIPAVRVDERLLQRGRAVFESNCEQCHGAAAQGAEAGGHYVAPPLDAATPVQIGEAIRIGPGIMPRFTPAQLPARDVDAVATYVRDLANTKQTYGGTTLGYLGPAAEGGVGAFFGVGMLFWVIYFTGTKADGRRLNELDRTIER